MKKCGLLVFLFLISICFCYPVFADSGWDSSYGGSSSSYDYGGSSDYGHDYSYDGSRWDYSSSHHSSSSHSSREDRLCLFFLIFALIMIFVIRNCGNKSVVRKNYYDYDIDSSKFIGDLDSEIQKYLPGMTEKQLIDILYQKFVDIQCAWMSFDYDKLQKLCSEELYASYRSDLEVLKLKHGQNIMSDFNLKGCNIKGITMENGLIIVQCYLYICFYDFVVDTTTGEVIRGKKDSIHHNQYDLKFVLKSHDQVIKCPSCGAEVSDGENVCSSCHTVINNNYDDFVLASKTKIF